MEILETAIPDVLVIRPRRFEDARGFFAETYNERALAQRGVDIRFVQDNHAYSARKHTLRGLHYQAPPAAQDKLVRVVRGAVLDVAVDIRRDSPTFGKWVSRVLSEENFEQLLVPKGFAHGVLTLEDHTHVLYKVSAHFSPEHDLGLRWNDPAIGIDWGVDEQDVLLSEKDLAQPLLHEAQLLF